MPNKFLGQHFLKNESVIKKIIAAIAPQKGETIVEVGSGHGELTRPLAAACKKAGARLIAIEKDRGLASALRSEFQNNETEMGAEIIEGDVLKAFSAGTITLAPPFKIVGNIPYYLTGRLLRVIGELNERPVRTVLMVQKEVAERLMAEPPGMNRLAASVQFWAKAEVATEVPKENFDPRPKVGSVVLLLDRDNGAEHGAKADAYYTIVRILFAQPRKTVENNLRARFGKEGAIRMLETAHIDPKLRPQDLSIQNIKQIGGNLML